MDYVFLVAGLSASFALGAAIAWLGARSKFKIDLSGRISELEGKARYVEGNADQLKLQIARLEEESTELRTRLDGEKTKSVGATTRLEEAQRNLVQQKELICAMRNEMVETFKAHALSALEVSNRSFLQLAQENLGGIIEQTKGKLGEHHSAMEGIIKPLAEMLSRYEDGLKGIEKNRNEHYGSLAQSIQALSRMNEQLQRETNTLVTALRKPQVSGNWGQMSLRRAAELSGMVPNCDFFEEVSITTEDGRLRPDMIIKLPNGRSIVVDAKAPVDAYLSTLSASSDEERKRALSGYISQVRNHMNSLGMKSYWEQLDHTPEMVIMYLPGEAFFSAALENDPKLIEDGTQKRVILATPTTLIALLRAVAFGWQQEQIATSAQEINRLGKELFERFAVVIEHFGKLGAGLNKAVEAHNEAVRSIETRLIPSLRRFKELGISSTKELDQGVEEITQVAK